MVYGIEYGIQKTGIVMSIKMPRTYSSWNKNFKESFARQIAETRGASR